MKINELSFLAKFPHSEELSKCIKNFKNLISQDYNISLYKHLTITLIDKNKIDVYKFKNIHINKFYINDYKYNSFILSTDNSLLKIPNSIKIQNCYVYFCNNVKVTSNNDIEILK